MSNGIGSPRGALAASVSARPHIPVWRDGGHLGPATVRQQAVRNLSTKLGRGEGEQPRNVVGCSPRGASGRMPTGRSGQGEDLRAVPGDEDGVLHLGGAKPVGGDRGPAVV